MKAVRSGQFREDLYYRLDVLNIRVPPLRERVGDIPFLVRTLLRRKGIARRRLMGIDESLIHYFTSYSWPGNFRQLEAFLERLFALNHGIQVQEDLLRSLFKELPPDTKEKVNHSDADGNAYHPAPKEGYLVSGTLAETEEQIIREAYRRCCGNIGTLSETLGIGRTTLWRKLKQYGLRNSP